MDIFSESGDSEQKSFTTYEIESYDGAKKSKIVLKM